MKYVFPLIAMIVAFYAVSVLWITTDARAAKHTFDESSAANTSDEGVSLAYAYLRRHRHVEMLTRLVSSDHLARNGVVFRIGRKIEPNFLEEQEDEQSPKKKRTRLRDKQRTNPLLTSDEAEWVEHGGRMVLAMAGAVGPLTLQYDAEAVAHKVFPFAPGIERIALPERRGIAPSSLGARMVGLYISGKSVVVSREPLGAGDIIVITVPEMFQNKNLGIGNHLPLLIALSGASRPIYFDEYVHGLASADGPLDLLKEWRLGPFLVLILLVALLKLWRGAARVGPPEEEFRDTRSEAVDLVSSLGALYQKSMTDSEALTLYQDALTRTVAAQTGLRGEALQKRVAELLGGATPESTRRRLASSDLRAGLKRINNAFRKLAPVRRRPNAKRQRNLDAIRRASPAT
ncbi:MAG TPA: hypothetical protein VER58_17275 [Thermoanaerobaculia bacterium]|nr:hypothetical protein [Thermoanaerobaculia bacterium]